MNRRTINPDDYDRSELAGLVLQATGPIAPDYSNALVQDTELYVLDGVTLCGERPVLDTEGRPTVDAFGRIETQPWRGPLPHGHPWRDTPTP